MPPLNPPVDEFSALNALIQDRAARWSKEAHALKFEVEFKAVEQERRRVAKELHDEILPTLARLIRSIQSQDESESSLVVLELFNTVESFRELLGELHPVDLGELGLVCALSSLCGRYARITGRSITLSEVSEECNLSDFQQLCVYRAMQCVLRMFADSENDLLLVTYDRVANQCLISVQCIDKRVSSAEWLTAEKNDFSAFESWSEMAGARKEIGSTYVAQYACDLVISIAENHPSREHISELIGLESKIRLAELDSVLAHAQEEWASVIQRDRILFGDLALAAENERISKEIALRVQPHLRQILDLASRCKNTTVELEIKQCMQVVAEGISHVMLNVYPQQLAKLKLLDAISSLVDRFKRCSLIDATITSKLETNGVYIPPEVKFAIYRVVQESLNNVEKHSGATKTLVMVEQSSDEITISIEDNGKGFQARSTLSRGLKNIGERAAEIGASVNWKKPESFETGTLVTICLRSLQEHQSSLGCSPGRS